MAGNDLIPRMQQGIDRMRSMESDGASKEHIELVALQLRTEFQSALLLPPMHPVILEFAELVQKYIVR